MRFGYGLVTAQHHPRDPRPLAALYTEAVEYGVLSEQAGLDSYWTSEHHFLDDSYMSAQLPVLAAVAARTQRIRLGTGVLLAPLFDPLRLAEDAATVDLLSGGRLILGLGIGWRDEEFEGFGIPQRSRATRLEGTIAVLRQAWGDGLVTGDGQAHKFDDLGEMFMFYQKHPDEQVQAWFVHDYGTSEWTRAEQAFFVQSDGLHTPMGSGLAAFATREAAQAEAERLGATVRTFEEVRGG